MRKRLDQRVTLAVLSALVDRRLSQRQIAKSLGSSQSTVKYWLSVYGLKTRLTKTERTANSRRVPRAREGGSCAHCGGTNGRAEARYCSAACSGDARYQAAIAKWKAGLTPGLIGDDVTSKTIRRYIWEKYQGKCVRCGWCEVNPVTGRSPLHLEHIDGNGRNNDEGNLTLLCPNCHSLTPTYCALNIGNGRPAKRARYLRKGRRLIEAA